MLVYDGDCGFCSRAVQVVLSRDLRRTLRFAARDGVAGRAVRERHPELATVESLLWVEVVDGVERVRVLSDAALAAAVYLGGGWRLAGLIGLAVPRLIRDRVYTIVARYRKRVFGPADQSCLVIPASERSRFLP